MVGYTYSTITETRNEVKAKCEKKSSCKTNEGAFFEMHHQLISSQGLKRSKIRGLCQISLLIICEVKQIKELLSP